MNARVDPANLRPLQVDDADRDLILACRAAMRAIKEDVASEEIIAEIDARYGQLAPPYPKLEWSYSDSVDPSPFLRAVLKEYGPEESKTWREKMRAQIKAVAAWERETDALRKSLGLGAACRRRDRSIAFAKEQIAAVAEVPAKTVFGCSWKSMVAAQWFSAGYSIGFDEGEHLAMSILNDIRLLGTGGNNDGNIRLARYAPR